MSNHYAKLSGFFSTTNRTNRHWDIEDLNMISKLYLIDRALCQSLQNKNSFNNTEIFTKIDHKVHHSKLKNIETMLLVPYYNIEN